jgi:hypothetical protein
MKKLLFLTQIIVMFACSKDYLSLVNSKIKQINRQKNSISKTCSEARKIVIDSSHLKFISEKDTIYIIEEYDIPSATFYSSVWTRQGELHYGYLNGIEIKKESPFSKKIIHSVNNWDIAKIRSEEKINYNQLDSSHLITAYRIHNSQKNILVDTIKFRPYY